MSYRRYTRTATQVAAAAGSCALRCELALRRLDRVAERMAIELSWRPLRRHSELYKFKSLRICGAASNSVLTEEWQEAKHSDRAIAIIAFNSPKMSNSERNMS